ncbi:ATP-binding protein [Lysinibacillus cavernae]|uniref:ATP-binding protein n=1 Tax=Lysinibacillus cavernae TaxID=2666135 RepID=UPI0012D90D4C|nr:AAA family ATPase [Lysinibacillus cavernae]
MLTIQKIQIYGFGKHENITISLSDGVTIFYGLNEAGKTTIQQFILQMLFGFPIRQQTLRKYEPKVSTKYGGQLTLLHPIYGQCTIERVKGKATGDVSVYLENGATGQEELLAKLLYGYSRASFESIFSFSLHELQGIEKMSEEELTHLLLASGTTGIQHLSALEKKMDKEANELFKKTGKVPVINQKIEQIKQLERTIKQEQGKIQTFEDKLQQLQLLEQNLEQLYDTQKMQQQQWQQLTIQKQALPLIKQQQTLQQSLDNYQHVQFPPEGIRRYEQLKDRLLHESQQLIQLKEQYQTLQDKVLAIVDEQTVDKMSRLMQKEATWHQLMVKEQNLRDDLFMLEQEIEAQFRLLGVQENEAQENLVGETVSLQQEQQFQLQLSKLEEAEEELKFHLRSLEQVHLELDAIAQQKQRLVQESLTNEEEHILAQWPQQKRKLEQLRAIKSQRTKQQQPHYFIWLVLLIGLLSLAYGLFEKNMAMTFIGGILSLLILLYIRYVRQADEPGSKEHGYLLRELEQEEMTVQAVLLKKQRYEDRWLHVNEQQKEKEQQYVQLEYKIQQTELESEEATQALQLFLKRYRLQGTIARTLMPELFMRIRNVQELAVKRNSTLSLLQDVQVEKKSIYEQLQQVLNGAYNENEIYMYLRTTYLEAQQRQQQALQTKDQLASLKIKINGGQSTMDRYTAEMTQLFSEAQVPNEQAYYEMYEQFEQQRKITTELQAIQTQLTSLNLPQQVNLVEDAVLEGKLALEQEQSSLQLEIDRCLEQRAALLIEKEQLLNDEKYGQLLQQFEQEKTELQQLIEQWATKKAVATAIHETLFRLREEKLPHVLSKVNAIFRLLTGGRYDKLSIHDEGYFVAQDVAGIRYQMAELSQATKEQAYIALRMSLAQTLVNSAPFPIIMDDPFVHFDRNRTDKMVQLMKEVGYERQILYFTCHDTMLKHWQKEQIVDIGALANERGVAST